MRNETGRKSPWDDEQGSRWLAAFGPWRDAIRIIHGTLRLETNKHPQEIRAAAALVVLFCRENLWPTRDQDQINQILDLAVRQLTTIKQLYETKARANPEMLTNKNYRNLLVSIDQEVRILEARSSENSHSLPNQPPCTWGEFWI